VKDDVWGGSERRIGVVGNGYPELLADAGDAPEVFADLRRVNVDRADELNAPGVCAASDATPYRTDVLLDGGDRIGHGSGAGRAGCSRLLPRWLRSALPGRFSGPALNA
jgi:hypothetical protein